MVRHYRIRTEPAWLDWIQRFIRYQGRRHAADPGEAEVAAFLIHLAVDGGVAAATHKHALNVLALLYSRVLERPLGQIEGVASAKRPAKLPVARSPHEVGRMLAALSRVYWLVACLQYGSGLRLMASVRLRVKDLEFTHRALVVRRGKGGRDHVVTLPDKRAVQEQLGHADVCTARICTDVIQRGGRGLRSPLGALLRLR